MDLRKSREYQSVVAPLRFALDKSQIFDPLYWASRAFPNSKIVSFLRRVDNALYKAFFGESEMKYPPKAFKSPQAQQHATRERQQRQARDTGVSQTPAIDAAIERRNKILAKDEPDDIDTSELQRIEAGFEAVRSALDGEPTNRSVNPNDVFKTAYRETAAEIARQQDTAPALRAERAQSVSNDHVLS